MFRQSLLALSMVALIGTANATPSSTGAQVVSQVPKIMQDAQGMMQDQAIASLKKIIPDLVIYKISQSPVRGFMDLDTSVDRIYLSEDGTVLLKAHSLALINTSNIKLDGSIESLKKLVADNMNSPVDKFHAEKNYYVLTTANNTIIIDKNNTTQAIFGMFSTMQQLQAMLKQKATETPAVDAVQAVAPVSVSKTQSSSDESLPQMMQKTMQYLLKTMPNNFVNFKVKKGGDKGTLYVFTDYTCPHCQEFHKHLDDFLNNGYNVDYLLLPRAGANSLVAQNMQKALCAVNPKIAVELLYQNHALPANLKEKPNCKADIKANLAIASSNINVTGTPTIIGSNGRVTAGFTTSLGVLQKLGMKV